MYGCALGGLLTRTGRAACSYGYTLKVQFLGGVSTPDAAVFALLSAYDVVHTSVICISLP